MTSLLCFSFFFLVSSCFSPFAPFARLFSRLSSFYSFLFRLLLVFLLFSAPSVSFLPSFASFSRFHPALNFPQMRKNRPVYDYRNHSPSQRIFSHISRTIRIRFSQKKKTMIHVSRTWRSIKFEHVSILYPYIYIYLSILRWPETRATLHSTEAT